ncbi:MAG TPA: tripartite tricarboxylate transporter substrate binding protein, partial [Burkholderiales bacterium]
MRSIAFLAGALFAGLALAQPYPSKPLRMIVPFPPGGVTDVMSRAVAARLSAEMGQPVVVENRAGASGIIGAEAGAKAPADGYTITMGNISTLAVNSATFAKLPYDPVTSFAPISMVAIQPLVVAVHPSLPVQSLPDLVRYAKSKPGELSYGTAGSSIHLAVEYFSTVAGIRMNHVPYKGSAPAITDLIGGQLQVLFDPFSSLYPQVRGGKARGLAVTTERRSSVAPELPTVSDLGYKGFDVSSWQGLVVPAATPKDIVERLHRDTVKLLGSAEIKEQFAKHGAEPAPTSPEKFAEYIRGEIARWQKVARDAGVKP